jgi:sulfite exporter TauE/SafE
MRITLHREDDVVTQYLSPRWFLTIGGIVLAALGIIGFIAWYATGQAENNIFYLDNGENVAHTVLGVVALILAAITKANDAIQKWVVVLVGLVALFFGVYGFAVGGDARPNTFGLGNLENPLDNLLHLVVGVWALASAFMPKPSKAQIGQAPPR